MLKSQRWGVVTMWSVERTNKCKYTIFWNGIDSSRNLMILQQALTYLKMYHSNLSNCTPNIIVCIFHWPWTVHMQNLEIQKLLWTFNLNLLCLLQSYWWFCFNFRVQVSGVCGHVTTLQPTLPTLFILRLVQTKLTIVGVTHILVITFQLFSDMWACMVNLWTKLQD